MTKIRGFQKEDLEILEILIKDSKIILTEKNIFNFLKISKRWPFRYPWNQPSVEIITNNEELNSDLFFDVTGYLNFDRWKQFYDLGFTTIISNVLDLNEDLRILNDKLTKATGLKINGNFYFSKPGQRVSWGDHTHTYDVIAKQIYGTSDWVVGGKEILLSPQETVIIPKETYHKVTTMKHSKLSLTINIE